MERLKSWGLIGLTLFFMVLLFPLALLSFVITVKVGFYILVIGVMLAAAGYILVLPTTTIAALTGNSDNPRFMVVGVGLTLALIGVGWGYVFVQGEESRAEFRAEQAASIEAGVLMECTHPDLNGTGEGSVTFPAEDIHITTKVQGWTCYTAGRTYTP